MAQRQSTGIVIIAFLLSFAAQAGEFSLRYYNNDKYELVKITEVQKTRVTSNCIKNGKPSCKAWSIFLGKPFKVSAQKVPLLGNPAAHYCWDVGAKNRILKADNNEQTDYCVFDDNSMIDSWDLYYKHFPPPPPIK
ncbi:MAG: DUF333 domain-containing protein [Bdellovibrio sp.]|nr:DUF333 domain-containing protein [Bdellovibrio sp.]